MLNIGINRTIVIWGLVALALQSSVVAQVTTETSALFKASISVDFDTLEPLKPGMVTVKIENISGREIDLKSTCHFELFSMRNEAVTRAHRVFGDSYWGPVNVSDGTPLRLDIIDPKKLEKGIVEGRVPKASLHFAKNELKTFKVDLTKLHWSASMAGSWPSWSLFEVVEKGPYALVFMFRSGAKVKSNEIKVAVE